METNTDRDGNFANVIGARVTTPDGTGTLRYHCADGAIGVQIDGERGTHEWSASQVVGS